IQLGHQLGCAPACRLISAPNPSSLRKLSEANALRQWLTDAAITRTVLELEEGHKLSIQLQVSDNDLGLNGSVQLKLLFDYDGLFRLERNGTLHSVQSLNTSSQLASKHFSWYHVCIRAADQAPKSLS